MSDGAAVRVEPPDVTTLRYRSRLARVVAFENARFVERGLTDGEFEACLKALQDACDRYSCGIEDIK